MDLFEEHTPGELSETDLALVDVMQRDVRAPWARIGAQLGTSAPTARRHWHRLVENGAAWLTSYARPSEAEAWAIVEVRCQAGTVDGVAAALVAEPRILTVSGVTGERDLVLLVGTATMLELRKLLQQRIGAQQHVVSARTALLTRMYVEGSSWRQHPRPAATQQRSHAIEAMSGRARNAHSTMRVLSLLERDGRATPASLGDALGVGPSYARRVTNELLAARRIIQRVDLSLGQRHWPHALVLWLVAPAASIDAVARRIAALPLTRLCASVAGGPANLYAVVWLHDVAEAPAVEAQIVGEGGVRVFDRSLMLHYYKRVGHIFGEDGRRSGFTSWASVDLDGRMAGEGQLDDHLER